MSGAYTESRCRAVATGHENPVGLFGVFLSSGCWIVCGILIWQWLGDRFAWFFAVQLLAFVGQGLSALAGEAIGLPSNFFEQLVTWALIGLGWQLQREVTKHNVPRLLYLRHVRTCSG